MNILNAKMAFSSLVDIRKEDSTFSFNIWVQPKDKSSDSNATSSNCLSGKLPLGSEWSRMISAFSCFLLGHKCNKKGLLQKTLPLCIGSSALCANEKYFSQ